MSARRIGIVLYPDAEELDWAGPYEVFKIAAEEAGDSVVTIAETADPVRCAHGLRVLPDETFETAASLDVVVVPGGEGSRVQMNNSVMIDWLRAVSEHCTWVTSVCTGTILLCRAGLAEDCEVTTHWSFIEELRALAPKVTVRDDIRYVRAGRVVTAAGISAGIDMALWLVGEIYGEDRGRETQRELEYEPDPPF